jgi:VIT family
VGHNLLFLRRVRKAFDSDEARQIIADALPPFIAAHMRVEKLESLRGQLKRLPEPPPQPRIARDDLRGALGIFLLAFGSIFPVVIPFIFMSDAKLALRVSNGIAILLLFLAGYALGRYASRHPWRVGLAMVGVAIALGGKAETKIDGFVGDVVASGHRGIGTDRATQAWAFKSHNGWFMF